MLLTIDKSLCEIRQKTIVSKDQRSSRKHCARNLQQKYNVRHYKLDGKLISQKTCCDFLLINDTVQRAYFIELKGRHIEDAISQLESGYNLFRSELKGYEIHLRIVPSKARTHSLRDPEFRKFKAKWGSRLKCKEEFFEEDL